MVQGDMSAIGQHPVRYPFKFFFKTKTAGGIASQLTYLYLTDSDNDSIKICDCKKRPTILVPAREMWDSPNI